MDKLISDVLNSLGIYEFGFCRFEEGLPLFDTKNKVKLPKSPKSIIVAVFPYFIKKVKDKNISYYASVEDYHNVILPYLNEACASLSDLTEKSFSAFVDNSPIREVNSAVACGLGVKGDNGLFISKKYGSFVFLGEIVTDLELSYFEGEKGECLHCGKCKSACPTGVLKDGYDFKNCLSFITQKKSELTSFEEALIRDTNTAWGCDICQSVCPLNEGKEIAAFKGFTRFTPHLTLDNLDAVFKESAFSFRGGKPIKRNLEILNKK